MRIHTDKITHRDIYRAASSLPGVYAEYAIHGSRSKAHAYEVRLEGTGTTNPNDSTKNSATWDEWGVVIARLFEIDPNAFWGTASAKVYANSGDFHSKTGGRFRHAGLPGDTHPRHRWQSMGIREQYCSKCSAYRRFDF